jgi:hypothetical protein
MSTSAIKTCSFELFFLLRSKFFGAVCHNETNREEPKKSFHSKASNEGRREKEREKLSKYEAINLWGNIWLLHRKKLVGTVGKNFLPSFVNVLLWKIFNLDHGKGNSFLLIARFTTAMAGLTQLGMLEVP